jgi:glycosyltransferase involved in cell wall biosynthesis
MALVSIIIPSYNHQSYINKCLESVRKQKFKDWEAVIVDDGSTDNTNRIVQKYLHEDDRFQLITQSNKGLEKLGETYNTALAQCKGKWIAVLEGDDYWHPEKLSVYVASLEESNAVMAWGCAYNVDDSNKVLGVFPRREFHRYAQNIPVGLFLKDYLLKSFVPSPSLMFRSDCLQQIGGFIQPSGMTIVDYPTVLAMSLKGEFYFIKRPLLYYRIHSAQATSSGGVDADAAGRYARLFFEGLSEEMHELLGIRISQMDKRIAQRKALNDFHRGRIALIQGEYEEASRFFRAMRVCHNPGIVGRTYLGLLHSSLKMDLEWVPRFLGMRPLK